MDAKELTYKWQNFWMFQPNPNGLTEAFEKELKLVAQEATKEKDKQIEELKTKLQEQKEFIAKLQVITEEVHPYNAGIEIKNLINQYNQTK